MGNREDHKPRVTWYYVIEKQTGTIVYRTKVKTTARQYRSRMAIPHSYRIGVNKR